MCQRDAADGGKWCVERRLYRNIFHHGVVQSNITVCVRVRLRACACVCVSEYGCDTEEEEEFF